MTDSFAQSLLSRIAKVFTVGVLACSLLLTGCSDDASQSDIDADGKLSVIASFYPMYDFANKIGGDRIELINLVPAGTEPHDWEPTASDITELEKADVLIYNGVGMEHWVDDVLDSLGNKELSVVEASENVMLIEGSEEEEDGVEHTDAYDPHVWLDPENAKIEMQNIKDAFVAADPENQEYYEDNYATYAAELDALDAEFTQMIEALPNKDLVVTHEAFGYLCDAYGLNQVGIMGLSPDAEPDAGTMASVIDYVNEHDVKVIFFEELVSPKVAEAIAEATGAQTAMLNPLEGLTDEEIDDGEDYFSVMRGNLEAIKEALQ